MKKWEIVREVTNQKLQVKSQDIIEILLENRGLKTKEQIEEFLHPKLESITLEAVNIEKKQVEKALGRIKKAIKNKEKVIIYGDYDVDGITASAILWETLHMLGAQVLPYIPHRVEEGYGLSIKGIENILNQKSDDSRLQLADVKLIITVDNGIVAQDAVTFANSRGIDVIITDHHTLSPTLPDAYAIVHTTKLCGAGIAYLLAQELKIKNEKLKIEDNILELAALGTVADLVPLTEANRSIVKFGLEKLSHTKRLGLQELFKEAGCKTGNLGVYEVGHIIAPRLNATGRMASAMDSLRLLCTKDRQKAESLAALLGTTNRERQNVMIEAARHASLSIHEKKELKKLLIVSHGSYPEGVIGLVAGRLVEEFYRPAIVISKGGKYSKGSVRSISGFNIIEFLRQSSEFFVNIGGHPMAAGFTIETEKIEKMQETLEKFAHDFLHDGMFSRLLKIDCEIPLVMITQSLYKALQTLSPFGMGNPEPVFVTRNVSIEDMRVLGKEGKHLKLTVRDENAEFHAIAFGFGEDANKYHIGDTIDVAYTILENTWNGRSTLELKVKDIVISKN